MGLATPPETSARSQSPVLILEQVLIGSRSEPGPHRPVLRWAVPTAILAVAAVTITLVVTIGSGTPIRNGTPTADGLISALHDARGVGYSGTIIAQMSLDLPVGDAQRRGQAPVLLMAGAHTLRYWYGGPNRQRVALLGNTSESDVFHNGGDVWQWDSRTRVATLSLLAPAAQAGIGAPMSPAPLTLAVLTPQLLAERSLAAIDSQTDIDVRPGPRLSDRRTYELVLVPDGGGGSRIGAVHIDVDAERSVPLGVQVYARGARTPAIDVSFASVTFKTPAADYFSFSPPSGATVQRGAQPQLLTGAQGAALSAVLSGQTGWSAITEYRAVDGSGSAVPARVQTLMSSVSGDWGSGELLDTPLLCMLVTSDGRVLAGSVDPTALYAAAAAG